MYTVQGKSQTFRLKKEKKTVETQNVCFVLPKRTLGNLDLLVICCSRILQLFINGDLRGDTIERFFYSLGFSFMKMCLVFSYGLHFLFCRPICRFLPFLGYYKGKRWFKYTISKWYCMDLTCECFHCDNMPMVLWRRSALVMDFFGW